MKEKIYLVADRRRVVDMRKMKPDLDGGQVAIQLEIEIPPSYFDRLAPTVKVRIPDVADLAAEQVEVTFSSVVMEVGDGEGEGVAAGSAG